MVALEDETGDSPFEKLTTNLYMKILEISKKNKRKKLEEIRLFGPPRQSLSLYEFDVIAFEEDGNEYGFAFIIDYDASSRVYTFYFDPGKDFEKSILENRIPEAFLPAGTQLYSQNGKCYVRNIKPPENPNRDEGHPRQTRYSIER